MTRVTRPLVPLAVCFLLLLALTDRFFPFLFSPPRNPIFESSVGDILLFNGRVGDDPVVTADGVRFTLEEDRGAGVVVTVGQADPAWRDALHRGDRVRFTARLKRPVRYANPGAFDYRRFLERKGILYTAYIDDASSLLILEKAESFAPVVHFRDRARSVLADVPGESRDFLRALVLGESQTLSEDLREAFQITGTSHVVAISGQHIGLLAGFCFFLFRALFRRSERLALHYSIKTLAWIAAILPVLFYTVLAGAPPSAVRAMILLCLFVATLAWSRDPDPLSALAFGAIMIAAFEPSAVFSASFQLSFLALLGILVLLPETRSDGKWGRYILWPFLMTVAATLLTSPLVAYRFHQVSWSGFFVNLWAIPAVSFLLVLSLCGVVIGTAVPAVVPAAAFVLEKATNVFLAAIRFSAQVTRDVPLYSEFYPTEGELFWIYTGLGLALMAWKFGWNWKRACTVVTGVCLIACFSLWRPVRDLEIVFLDVGQGDGALILTPEGQSLLIDGGGFLIRRSRFDVGHDVIVPYLKRRGVKRLDGIILSHPHPDHFGGLAAVVREFDVGDFWWNGQAYPGPEFEELVQILEEKKITPHALTAGDDFFWRGLRMTTLYPDKVRPTRGMNDNSLVVKLAWNGVTLLFPGDIEDLGEAALSERPELRADILKIPHHASRTSSSVPFIDTVNPKIAVASLSDGNLFGFPHPGILEKYIRRGVRVFRTDRDGAVSISIPENYPEKDFRIETVLRDR